jgi:hypothetical protein
MAWQTNPTTLLNASGWYRISDLAALFGVLASQLEAFLGIGGYDRVQGGQVLMQIANLGGAGSWNYIAQAGETSGTVAAFEAVDQN